MNLLSIGNSFSQDAQRYLHQIANADGFSLNAFNLFIGGCSLSRHYRNMISDERAYTLEMNGNSTGFAVSLKEALLNRCWDIITIQQVSFEAPYYDTYQPYLDEIIRYVRHCVPKAKIAVHQTWAYEKDSRRLTEELGYENHADMLEDIKTACEKAKNDIGADFIIPSGEVFQRLLACGIERVHRDTFHADKGVGRYALGLLWYALLSRNDVMNNMFSDFDEEICAQQIEIVKKCVTQVCKSYGI